MAMRIVAETARLMGAPRLIPIASAHIDGALYHGDSGTLFAEALVDGGAKVAVRATLNVGALDLIGCSRVPPAEPHARDMARRMMAAYRGDGLRADLDLRALSGRPPPGTGQRRRLGRVQRRGVLQFGARRAHQPLWRFPRHRLRDLRAARPTTACTGRRTAAPRWSSTSAALPAALARARTSLWPVLGSLVRALSSATAIGVVDGRCTASRRGRAEGVRRGRGLVRRRSACSMSPASPRKRPTSRRRCGGAERRRRPSASA